MAKFLSGVKWFVRTLLQSVIFSVYALKKRETKLCIFVALMPYKPTFAQNNEKKTPIQLRLAAFKRFRIII